MAAYPEGAAMFIPKHTRPLLYAEAEYTGDSYFDTSHLPSSGVILKADRLTQVNFGETLTAAELAKLNVTRASRYGEEEPRNVSVIYVPRSCGRVPIPLPASVPANPVADTPVTITELPSNGSVFLADGMTAVVCGQTITAAQLCGLTFGPAADAVVGQISLLRYQSFDQALTGEVLLIVGSDAAPSRNIEQTDAANEGVSVTAIAAALLLQAGLSSLHSTAASAAVDDPNDFLPTDPPTPTDVVGAIVPSITNQMAPPMLKQMAAPAILAQSTPAETTSSTEANAEPSDRPPRHHIGSSSLLDLGNLKLAPLPQSAAFTASTASPPTSTPPRTGSHWTNSNGGLWNAAANWSAAPGGTVVDNGIIEAAPTSGGSTSRVDIKGNVSGTGSFEISSNGVIEIGGSVSGQVTNGSFSGVTVSFVAGSGELILDRSAQFHGLIGSSSPNTPLSPNDLIDLKDLPFTSGMTASVYYDSAANISTVDFSNGSKTVTLQFAGQDLNWTFKSDGNGGTIVADPPTSNAIVLENQKQGTPESVWAINPGQDSTKLEGFTTAISTNIGGTMQFKIDNLTGSPNYQIQIYRLGYYGGDGARLITTLQHTTSVTQPNPIRNAATGEVDAGNWSVTDSWTIPTGTVSGVYIANVVQGTQVFQIPFVVKDPNSTSDIVFQTSDETWQAYNGFGGANLYGGNGPSNVGGAYAVSYNRPILTRDSGGTESGPQDSLFGAEYAAIYWMEENGYDVSYISGMDTATNGALLLNHKVFMDDGHDEYWTDSQVANVEAAKNAGVNLAFLSGNEIFWQTQFTPSIDGSNTANRTLVTYKDSHVESLINPSGQGTGTFEAPTSWGGANTPSNALTGTVFSVDENGTLGTIQIPYDMTQLRFWRNTGVAATAPGQAGSLINGLLGYEWDSSPDNGFMPAGLIDLSSTTVTGPGLNVEFGNVDTTGTATHNLVEYRDPTSGALVFGAGTVFWSWGLSNNHDGTSDGNTTQTDRNVQQAMVNLFADMGVQPQTLQASLVIASQSTDHTAPTSKITSVSSTNVVEGGSVAVSGTASDVGGVIGGVQISTDGGNTWHPTSGQIGTQSVTWTYTFNAPAPGTYSIKTRAVDDSLNLETPSQGTSYTTTPSSALSLFLPSATPATLAVPDASLEVGMKFISSTNGEITGVRFYKGSTNIGTHIGDLWSSNGTLLASATFTNETASGWQQVNFSSPVKITAGTTYIVSYHTNGNYSDTPYYFDTNLGFSNGSLTAPGQGLGGLYAYGSGSIFPNNVSASGDNFWVDAVFKDDLNSPVANNDSGFVATQNTPISIAASALLANDTDPRGLSLSITGVSNPVDGTVSYNASTQTITFVPTTAGSASFTYSIADTAGGTSSANVSIAVNNPSTAQTLFSTTDTPANITVVDNNPVELGVKFQALTNGTITGIRFYKGPQNTGTHIADLWSASGTLLATATFIGESASGWQQVNFSSPVSITAGTTYIASYHTSGDYSADSNYFANAHTSGALTALASGTSGGDGVYSYGAGSVFPTNSFGASNYWVDVVFQGAQLQPPVANNDSGLFTGLNTTLSIPASVLLANDTDPNGLPLSITAVSNPSNGTVTYNSSTQTVSFVPTTGYTGPASFTYSITDGRSGTASANVSLAVTPPPPVANNDSGFVATEKTALSIPASALLANDTDPNGSQLSITGVSNPIDGTVSYNASTQTVTFVPSTAGTASFTYTITDALGGLASANASIAVNNPSTAQTLFSPTDTPATITVSDNSPVELGVKFTASRNGTITGIRFYKGPQNTGTHVADLWTSTGTLLATATFTNESASGWQQVDFSSPVAIAAGTTYIASYHTNGDYSADNNYFTTAHTNGSLTAPASGTSGGDGVYAYGTGSVFPTNTFNASNYWVDVVFEGNALQPPVANNDSGFAATENTALSIPASALLVNDTDPNGLPLSIAAVSNPSNGTVTYNSSTQTVSFVPTTGYSGPASFTYSITDGQSGTASANVSLTVNPLPPVANNDSGFVATENTTLSIPASALLANDTDPNGLPLSITGVSNSSNGTVSYNSSTQTVSFVPTIGYTGSASFTYSITDGNGAASANVSLLVNDPTATVSLFSPTSTPAIAAVSDPNAVELGVKFQASENGQITGLRFYKGPGNNGPHVADLWSSTGTLLATATFTNETASGWQQVNFATQVTITAGTTYVASYHTNSGDYAADPNLFATALTNGPLTAPSSSSSGGNGVYAYGSSSLFPTNNFNSTSYGVDVVFKPQLAA
jgi:hypothetical protein